MRYYAVFDTNVLISSLLTKRTDTATALGSCIYIKHLKIKEKLG